MAIPFAKPVMCPVLIGRSSYLETLHQCIDRAKNRIGQAVLISGEAGIGKSRLVAEAKADAIRQGFLVLQGNCFQPDSAYPYAPLLDLLHPYLTIDPLEADTPQWASIIRELSRLLPELVPLSTPPEPPSILGAEHNKRRLFGALLEVFGHFVAQQPILLIVEDLHWSDDTSLEFLHRLARWSKAHPIFLLVTYRSDEIRPSLRQWLAQLDRERLTREVFLTHLTRTEVSEMLAAIFDLYRPVRTEFLDTIYALTDGNPFFIEEILKSLVTTGEISFADGSWDRKAVNELHIPRSVQDAVQVRMEQLSERAKQTVVSAAVAGRRFDFTLLQALTQLDERELLRGIKELMAAQLIVEESSERFAFRHALTRQAIYANLLIRERAGLHRKIAETIERLHADALDAYGAELAYHAYEAGQWDKALHYCWRVGERSRQLYACQSAIEQFSHALEAAHHLDLALPSSLYRERAQAYQTLGQFEHAQADFESAIRSAQVNKDQTEEWQALLGLGRLWTEHDYPKAITYLQDALKLARSLEQPVAIARTLNQIGNWYTNTEQPLEALHYHKEALAIFERLDSKPGLAETLSLLGFTYSFIGDLWQGATSRDRAIELFRELDDRPSLVSAYCSSALCSPSHTLDTAIPSTFTLDEASQRLDIALRMAREINFPEGEAWALDFLTTCALTQGAYTRALEYANLGMAIAEEIGQREIMCSLDAEFGALYLDLYALDQAQQHLERALAQARAIGTLHFARVATGWLAPVYVYQGQFDRAQAALDAVIDTDTPKLTPGQRRCWYGRAMLALARGDAQSALAVLDELASSAPNSSSGAVIPLLANAHGEALIALGRLDEAEFALRAARTTAATQNAWSLVWRADALMGKLYRLQERRREAEEALQNARTVIDDLAAHIQDETLRATFLHGANRHLPAVRPVSVRQSIKQSFDGLTSREREVASLIARGLTNRQIGEALVISEETATVHVKHILNKLNFTSRAQIAAWAVQKNLVSVPSDHSPT